MDQTEKILRMISDLRNEVILLAEEKDNLKVQNDELLAALSEFAQCLTINCKNRKRRKDDKV